VPFTSTEKPRFFSVPVSSLPVCLISRIDFCCSPLSSVLPGATQRHARLCPSPGTAVNTRQKSNAAPPAASFAKVLRLFGFSCIIFNLHSAGKDPGPVRSSF